MPANGIYHKHVRNALKNDDWHIAAEHFYFRIGEDPVYIDFAANKMIVAERGPEKIAVEVKSFAGHSWSSDFHVVLAFHPPYKRPYTGFAVN